MLFHPPWIRSWALLHGSWSTSATSTSDVSPGRCRRNARRGSRGYRRHERCGWGFKLINSPPTWGKKASLVFLSKKSGMVTWKWLSCPLNGWVSKWVAHKRFVFVVSFLFLEWKLVFVFSFDWCSFSMGDAQPYLATQTNCDLIWGLRKSGHIRGTMVGVV